MAESKSVEELVTCVLELLFALDWATFGLGMMVLLEIFSYQVIIAAAFAHWIIGDADTWDELWEFMAERYDYRPGNAVKAWAKTMIKKIEEACV